MHPLQTTFASREGEMAWTGMMRRRIEAGRYDRVEASLEAALTGLEHEDFTGEMVRLCREASREAVSIEGWDVLVEAIAEYEGDPVTGMTLAIGNDVDLAFEKGRLHRPWTALGLYTDEVWNWSDASRKSLIAECEAECPGWAGTEEDIEVWLEIEGLDALNTALIHHKLRHHIRTDHPCPEGQQAAPLRYVEFIVGCWWRALRFHQAVQTALAEMPLPGAITVVSGMVDMRPSVASAHLAADRAGQTAPRAPSALRSESAFEAPDMAIAGLIQRKPIEEEEKPVTGADLRKLCIPAEDAEPEAAPGRLARLLGRG